ncbi:Na+/H+ antiporter NhaA [Glutamicibacter sp. HZAU]|uniref:Na+/H+ antiporter NhaA n=1 Tax=Glutamicibacter sp. HZAU TaxID=2049891 RepID=UPI001F00210A|nr:Na+/H+ antiporter NhaA [Glutamicibacter sp. HZAU]
MGKSLPPALRTFLLTLAVVDDLLAISIIAIFYTEDLSWLPLLLALLPLAAFAAAVQGGVRAWWILIPLGVAAWALVHASGIHATVAGVLLGFMVLVVATQRAHVRAGTTEQGEAIHEGLAARFADRWSVPASVPVISVFAFFAAGVPVGGLAGLDGSLLSPVALGISAGLVLGKSIGITAATFLVTRIPGIKLDSSINWPDVLGLSFVAGIGFTVSLLVGELAFGQGGAEAQQVKVGVLCGSLLAAFIGAMLLGARNRLYRAAATWRA